MKMILNIVFSHTLLTFFINLYPYFTKQQILNFSLTYIDIRYNIIYILSIYKGGLYMAIDKSLLTGSTTTLILKLLDEKDMYGYEMIETLAKKSDHTFDLKAGTLYPILHSLEKNDYVNSYEEKSDNDRLRKYYHLTDKGRKILKEKHNEWKLYSSTVNKILNGGVNYAAI